MVSFSWVWGVLHRVGFRPILSGFLYGHVLGAKWVKMRFPTNICKSRYLSLRPLALSKVGFETFYQTCPNATTTLPSPRLILCHYPAALHSRLLIPTYTNTIPQAVSLPSSDTVAFHRDHVPLYCLTGYDFLLCGTYLKLSILARHTTDNLMCSLACSKNF